MPWSKSLFLVLGYVLYALTCSVYVQLIAKFCPITAPFNVEEQWAKAGDGAAEDEKSNIRASAALLAQPEGNFK